MNHICVIGVNGVGAAHALSAVKWLSPFPGKITLVDNANWVLERFTTDVWTNSWGPMTDSCVVNCSNLSVSLSNKLPDDADLYIIATPNRTHSHYFHLLHDKNVLCEKPLVEYGQQLSHISDKLHCGIEWIYHPLIENYSIDWVRSIQFIHGFPPKESTIDNRHQVYDLGTHLLGIVQEVNNYVSDDLKNIKHEGTVTSWEAGGVSYECGYVEGVTTDTVVINGEIELDWIPYDHGDLFYRQIDWIMTDGVPLFKPEDLLKHDSILHRIRSIK